MSRNNNNNNNDNQIELKKNNKQELRVHTGFDLPFEQNNKSKKKKVSEEDQVYLELLELHVNIRAVFYNFVKSFIAEFPAAGSEKRKVKETASNEWSKSLEDGDFFVLHFIAYVGRATKIEKLGDFFKASKGLKETNIASSRWHKDKPMYWNLSIMPDCFMEVFLSGGFDKLQQILESKNSPMIKEGKLTFGGQRSNPIASALDLLSKAGDLLKNQVGVKKFKTLFLNVSPGESHNALTQLNKKKRLLSFFNIHFRFRTLLEIKCFFRITEGEKVNLYAVNTTAKMENDIFSYGLVLDQKHTYQRYSADFYLKSLEAAAQDGLSERRHDIIFVATDTFKIEEKVDKLTYSGKRAEFMKEVEKTFNELWGLKLQRIFKNNEVYSSQTGMKFEKLFLSVSQENNVTPKKQVKEITRRVKAHYARVNAKYELGLYILRFIGCHYWQKKVTKGIDKLRSDLLGIKRSVFAVTLWTKYAGEKGSRGPSINIDFDRAIKLFLKLSTERSGIKRKNQITSALYSIGAKYADTVKKADLCSPFELLSLTNKKGVMLHEKGAQSDIQLFLETLKRNTHLSKFLKEYGNETSTSPKVVNQYVKKYKEKCEESDVPVNKGSITEFEEATENRKNKSIVLPKLSFSSSVSGEE